MAKEARDIRGRLIVVTILAIVVLAAAAMPLLTTVMIFDAGETPQAWTFFLGIWAVPLVMSLALIYAWIGYGAGSYNAARAGLVVTIIPLVLIGGLAVLSGIGILLS